jgi:hypothetical protein
MLAGGALLALGGVLDVDADVRRGGAGRANGKRTPANDGRVERYAL